MTSSFLITKLKDELVTEDSRLGMWTLDQRVADEMLAEFLTLQLLNEPKFKTKYGEAKARRDVGFYSNEAKDYQISNSSFTCQPLTPSMSVAMEAVNAHFGDKFNTIVLNRYDNGKKTIGPHYDDQSGIGETGVVTISLGETRTVRICKDKVPVLDFPSTHGLIMHMAGKFQDYYTHEIFQDVSIVKPRISVTFRMVK